MADKIALHLARFRDHFHTAHGHDRLSAVVRRDVVAWRDHLAAAPATSGLSLAPATVNTHLASLSGFTTWVLAHEPAALPHGNPCAKVGDLPLPALEPRAFAPAQIRTLKNPLDRPPRFHQHKGRRRAPAGELHGHARPLRDRAIVHVLLSTGLRREELVTVDLDQLAPSLQTDCAPRGKRRSATPAARAAPAATSSFPPTPAPRSLTTSNENDPPTPAMRQRRCSCPPPRSAHAAPTADCRLARSTPSASRSTAGTTPSTPTRSDTSARCAPTI